MQEAKAAQCIKLFEADERTALEVHQPWYILSMAWFTSFIQFHQLSHLLPRYSHLLPTTTTTLFPIDNSSIIKGIASQPVDDSATTSKDVFILKENLEEQQDYILLSKETWSFLYQWYGSLKTQILERFVIIEGTAERQMKRIEIYPFTMQVCKLNIDAVNQLPFLSTEEDRLSQLIDSSSSSHLVVMSKKATGRILRNFGCNLLKLCSSVRMWRSTPQTTDLELVEDLDATLEDSLIYPNQILLFEYKKQETDQWPFDSITEKQQKFYHTDNESETNSQYNSSSGNESSQEESGGNEEEEETEQKPKKKRRKLEPKEIKNINLETLLKWTLQSKERKDSKGRVIRSGLRGLSNLGNTCYMNSALQCLSNTVPLRNYFLSNQYKSHVNEKNPFGMKGKLATNFGILMEQMWTHQSSSSINTSKLKHLIGQFAPQFSGYNQQDAQEFLAFLLDGLHEDLNLIQERKVNSVEDKNHSSLELVEEDLAIQSWQQHSQRNQSIIVDLFHGQLKSTVNCPFCNTKSVKFDPVMYLSVPVPFDTKKIEILLMKPNTRPIKYLIEVQQLNNNPTIGLCKKLLNNLVSNSLTGIILADTNGSRIRSVLQDEEPISNIFGGKLLLFAFEQQYSTYPKIINFSQRIVKNKEFSLIGLPFILQFDSQTTQISGKQLYEQVLQYLKRTIKDVSNNTEQMPFTLYKSNSSASDCACKSNPPSTTSEYCQIDCEQCHIVNSEQNMYSIQTGDFYVIDWNSPDVLDTKEMMIAHLDNTVKRNKEKQNKNSSIYDCLQLFTQMEQLSEYDAWYCPHCKKHVCAYKKFELWSLPEILVIHFKRFFFNRNTRQKILSAIDFPIQGLDLTEFLAKSQQKERTTYDLFAVSHHRGTLNNGHYTSYAKHSQENLWHCYDDGIIQPVDTDAVSQTIQTKDAYVLFYAKNHDKKNKINLA